MPAQGSGHATRPGWHGRFQAAMQIALGATGGLPASVCTGRQAARGTRQWRAFSLAELMIALVILGLGLLFIAAALPVGLEYTRQTVDLATGEATAAYALNELERNLRTSKDLYDRNISIAVGPGAVPIRLDNIHRPRVGAGVSQPPDPRIPYYLRETYEPVFKVRPLALGNIKVGSVPSGSTREIVDDVEATITQYLNAVGFSIPANPLETDFDLGANTGLSLGENPVLPGLARVYPPIQPVTTFSAANFFNNNNAYPKYAPRYSTLTAEQLDREREKALERRVAWTAFYRRVSYEGDAGPDNQWYTGDDVADNSLLYELIVVVTRRTSVNHRFPRQALTGNLSDFEYPSAVTTAPPNDPVGVDRLAPTPWLVTFVNNDPTALPQLRMGEDYAAFIPDPNSPFYMERVLRSSFSDRPTLTFRCTPEVGALLPVGSIFIPAVNDQRYVPPPDGVRPRAGFVPSVPESLPIYEVVERPDTQTVIVKNNGYYPWVANPAQTHAFPVWVIPPAFVERDSNGQPIYERTSPIVQVVRRTVTLHEMRP